MAKGKKTGGRQKGSGNKHTATLRERIARFNCDPFEVLADIANGNLDCGVCLGAGKTRYQAAADGDRTFERVCQSCYGSKRERISPAERGKAAAELAQYIEAKRKAVEHTGIDGGPIEHEHVIRFVD